MASDQPILTAFEKAVQIALRDAARAALKESNRRAPVDDRDLVKSGRVTVDDLTVQISYTAPHARLQHENLDWKHEDGGEAKFLERAVEAVDVEQIIAQTVREQLDG